MSNQFNNVPTPIELFYKWETATPDTVFLRQPYGDQWKEITYGQAGIEARKITSALTKMGLQKGDHVGILSKNCYHWVLADLAIMLGGMISVPFYASLPKDQLKEVVDKSDIKAIFVGKLDAWGDRAEAIADQVSIISFPHYKGNANVEQGQKWDELISNNSPTKGQYIPPLDDIWTIMFTSGTTGSPKGVMHRNRTIGVILTIEEEKKTMGLIPFGKYFSYLPLNHVAEKIGVMMSAIYYGGSISFGESIDTFAKNLQDVQPDFFLGVPRIWTKFQSAILKKMPQKRLDLLLSIPIVSGIFKKKLKTALGLSNAKIVLTGAAITPAHLKNWYKKLGIHLREVYGSTEAGGSVTLTPINSTNTNNVGRAIPYTEIKIDEATQEVIFKTPQAMIGYYKDEEKTNEVLKDGWLYSGDRGVFDHEGNLQIIGRVTDAFKTSKGEFIAPNIIEAHFSKSEFIDQVCVAGLAIPQPIVLINLSESGCSCEAKIIEEDLQQLLEAVNNELSNYQKVSTIIIHNEAWTPENELLTPTMKIRRGRIDDRFSNKYRHWHEADAKIIWI